MSIRSLITFSQLNLRMIYLLIACHLLWSFAVFGLWAVGALLVGAGPWLAVGFMAFQLYAAAQLLLPALLLHPEERSRGFYLFWGAVLVLCVWGINQLPPVGSWQLLLATLKSGLLLLVATVAGAAMARYINRLWELVPVCIVMALADFASWLHGPTEGFVREIKEYSLSPEGPPPLVDMILVKLVFPGPVGLVPVFGVSDWIMVVFFAIVARRYEINDNLVGPLGEVLAQQGRIGFYLPVSVVALFIALVLAQTTGLFIPALPMVALLMLLWYATRYFLHFGFNRRS